MARKRRKRRGEKREINGKEGRRERFVGLKEEEEEEKEEEDHPHSSSFPTQVQPALPREIRAEMKDGRKGERRWEGREGEIRVKEGWREGGMME